MDRPPIEEQMISIKVYEDRAYMVTEEYFAKYEKGEIHFINHIGTPVIPKIFGRSGTGFNVTF